MQPPRPRPRMGRFVAGFPATDRAVSWRYRQMTRAARTGHDGASPWPLRERMSTQSPVGIIGLGLMGQALAERLFRAGFGVIGYDIEPPKGAWLAERGGQVAESVAEVAGRGDPILIAVYSTDQVEEVVERGIAPALGAGRNPVLLCTSTCDPDRIAALGDRLAARGMRFLELPVS